MIVPHAPLLTVGSGCGVCSPQAKNGYTWDYVLVVKVLEASEPVTPFQKRFSLKALVQRIAQVGWVPGLRCIEP
jgi:hypothetical protein